MNRATGPYNWAYLIMIICNVVSSQLLWIKNSEQPGIYILPLDCNKYRNVVRTFCDNCNFTSQGLSDIKLDNV